MNLFQIIFSDPTVRAKAYALIRQVSSMAAGALTGWLVAKGINLAEATILAGSVVALGGAVASVTWSMIDVVNVGKKIQTTEIVAVQAGINLVGEHAALDENGNIVHQLSDNTTPFKAVTKETAPQIIAKYGPDPSTLAKS